MPDTPYKVAAVRPYHDQIRVRIFEALTTANCEVVPEWTTPVGTPDEEVVEKLREVTPDVLLAPFHIGMTDDQRTISGLTVLRSLQAEYEWAKQVPTIMPISVFGGAGFVLQIEEFRKEHNDETILPLNKDQIAQDDLSSVISAHIAKFVR